MNQNRFLNAQVLHQLQQLHPRQCLHRHQLLPQLAHPAVHLTMCNVLIHLHLHQHLYLRLPQHKRQHYLPRLQTRLVHFFYLDLPITFLQSQFN